MNLYTICNEYTKASSDSFFSLSVYDKYRMKDGSGNAIYYGKTYSHTPYSEDSKSLKNIFKILAEAFKIIIAEYTDMDDVAYHQAFIRLVAGTDNRAKNTYF
jgi:hypothetical protein